MTILHKNRSSQLELSMEGYLLAIRIHFKRELRIEV
jgi:hypothetical protein